MQDLGTIHIDIEGGEGSPIPAGRSGGGGTAAFGGALSNLKSIPSTVVDITKGGAAISEVSATIAVSMEMASGLLSKSTIAIAATGAVVVGAFAAVAVGAYAFGKAMMKLNEFVMSFAQEIIETSPAMRVAQAEAQTQMLMTRLRVGGMVGGAISRQYAEASRVERAVFEIKGYAAGIGAAFLKPLTAMVASILEYIIANIDKVIDFLVLITEMISSALKGMASILSVLPAMLGGQGMGYALNLVALGFDGVIKELTAIKRNTQKSVDFVEANQMFINDLRLMGTRI